MKIENRQQFLVALTLAALALLVGVNFILEPLGGWWSSRQAQLKELQEALQKQALPNQDKVVLEFAKPEAANKDSISIVFSDTTVWALGSTFHYTFPDGTLEYIGKDLYDFLDRICFP